MRCFPSSRNVLLVAIFAIIIAPAGPLRAGNRTYARALESITRGELKAHIDVLADDTFEGREAGARGGHAAGGYIVKHLEQLGLKPSGERGSYYQTFNGSCRNLLALIEGNDPRLKQEVVLIGGHYDHVGYGTQRNSYGPWGYIHNGADDNASGTAGLLELAQALMTLPEPPRRTIMLAFWDAEEKGLWGSRHWLTSPTVAVDRVKCMINVDMIGRLNNRRVEVYGSRSAPGLRRAVSLANTAGLDLDFTWQMKDDSDHWPFFAQGVPVLMFHTGLHGDYHRPSDDAERINHAGLEHVSRLIFETTCSLANAQELGKFRVDSRRENETVRRALEQPAAGPAPRLGMTWRKTLEGDSLRLQVITVNAGSAADRAGIRIGDLVTAFEGQPIQDDLLFRQRILAAEQSTELTIERGTESPRSVEVTLQGPPIRVGVTARMDAAEPGVAIVSHVVYGSPAAVADIRINDRVDAVSGQAFTSATEFSRLLDQVSEQATLRVERRGVVSEIAIKVPGSPAPSP